MIDGSPHSSPRRRRGSGVRATQDSFESRRLHLSTILDGVGVIDGQLDAEGTEIVRQALALFSKRADGDTRSRAQRNADGLVTMARFALAHHDSPHDLTLLLCWFHHHVLHEQHWRLEPLGAGHCVLRLPTGTLDEFGRPRLEQLSVL